MRTLISLNDWWGFFFNEKTQISSSELVRNPIPDATKAMAKPKSPCQIAPPDSFHPVTEPAKTG